MKSFFIIFEIGNGEKCDPCVFVSLGREFKVELYAGVQLPIACKDDKINLFLRFDLTPKISIMNNPIFVRSCQLRT